MIRPLKSCYWAEERSRYHAWPGQPMTAHWGIPDPAKVEGSEAERQLAFADTLRMLTNRIGIFVSLPFDKLSKLSLQKKLDDIGHTSGEASKKTA